MRWRSSTGLATIGVTGVVALVSAALVLGTPVRGGVVRLLEGHSWLVKQDDGFVVLANGSSARVSLRLRIPDAAGNELEVLRVGDESLLYNGTTGELSRLDVADVEVVPTVKVGNPSTIDLVPAGDRLLVVDRPEGVIELQDPVSGSTLSSLDVGSDLSRAVVDSDGTAWVVDRRTGALVAVDTSGDELRLRDERRVVSPRSAVELSLVDDAPAVLDESEHALIRVPGGSPEEPVELPIREGEDPAIARVVESQVIPMTVNDSGALVLVDGDRAMRRDLGLARRELGAPVVFDGQVFVPDFVSGTLEVYDLATGRQGPSVAVGTGRFEVRLEGGRLWVNDPESDVAWVRSEGATFARIDKDVPEVPSNDAPPVDPPLPVLQAPVLPTPVDPPLPAAGPSPPPAAVPPTTSAPTTTTIAPALATPPQPPTIVQANPGDAHVKVTFRQPASDGGAPIRDYPVQVSPSDASPSPVPASVLQSGVGEVTIEGLANNRLYTVTVYARNAEGRSDRGATVSVTPKPRRPDQPTIAAFEPTGDRQLTLSVAPLGAGAPAVEQYELRVSDGNGIPVPGWPRSATRAEAEAGVLVQDVEGGSTYRAVVVGVSAAGEQGDPSAPASAKAEAAPTSAPDGRAFGVPGRTRVFLRTTESVHPRPRIGVSSRSDCGSFDLQEAQEVEPGQVVRVDTAVQPDQVYVGAVNSRSSQPHCQAVEVRWDRVWLGGPENGVGYYERGTTQMGHPHGPVSNTISWSRFAGSGDYYLISAIAKTGYCSEPTLKIVVDINGQRAGDADCRGRGQQYWGFPLVDVGAILLSGDSIRVTWAIPAADPSNVGNDVIYVGSMNNARETAYARLLVGVLPDQPGW